MGTEFYKNQISKFWYQLQYQFEMAPLVWRLYYSDDILMINIQTDKYIEYSSFLFNIW